MQRRRQLWQPSKPSASAHSLLRPQLAWGGRSRRRFSRRLCHTYWQVWRRKERVQCSAPPAGTPSRQQPDGGSMCLGATNAVSTRSMTCRQRCNWFGSDWLRQDRRVRPTHPAVADGQAAALLCAGALPDKVRGTRYCTRGPAYAAARTSEHVSAASAAFLELRPCLRCVAPAESWPSKSASRWRL